MGTPSTPFLLLTQPLTWEPPLDPPLRGESRTEPTFSLLPVWPRQERGLEGRHPLSLLGVLTPSLKKGFATGWGLGGVQSMCRKHTWEPHPKHGSSILPGRVKYNSRGDQGYVPLPPVPSPALPSSVAQENQVSLSHPDCSGHTSLQPRVSMATGGPVPEADQHLQQDGLTASRDRRDVKQQPGTRAWFRDP